MPIKSITLFLRNAVAPRSRNEDIARREFILNILLLSSIVLVGIAFLSSTANFVFRDTFAYEQNALPLITVGGIFLSLLALYILSRKGFVRSVSYTFITAAFVLTAYMGYRWGVDVPAQIVFYPLVIVMAGILINARFAFLTTLAAGLVMAGTGFLERIGYIVVNNYWKSELWTSSDIVMIVVMYFVIATVSWLSNREIEKSLKRARRSEAELKQERDTLEVRVEERTRELRQVEMEKMSQAYHFVEFGRLAGGIFHDLINPLAALSLNIDRIAETSVDTRTALSGDVARAKRAAAHMQKLMESMRKHLRREGSQELFSVRESLKDVTQMLTSYAGSRGVRLSLHTTGTAQVYGNPVAFVQVMTNLISNAIQSYPPKESSKRTSVREVVVTLESGKHGIHVSICDQGSGVTKEDLPNIFEPFFTTKGASEGIGIGLSLAKRIVEKDFGGTIAVESSPGAGSTFTVYLPVREP